MGRLSERVHQVRYIAGCGLARKALEEGVLLKLYVGNLSFGVSSDALQQLFVEHGEVASAELVIDRATGMCRGFAFVQMPNRDQALAAINALNGQEFLGRSLNVNEARPSTGRPDSGGRNPGGGGRGYGGSDDRRN